MADKFAKYTVLLDDPAVRAVAITPNDGADLAEVTRMIFVGGAGTLRVTLVNDTNPVTFNGLAAGTVLHLRVKKVFVTGTSCTGIIGLM